MPRLRLFLISLGAGTLMAVFGFGGLVLGAWLDIMLGTGPCLSLLLAVVGLAISTFLVYRLVLWGLPRR
jgi:hypothetical protein